MYSRLRGVPEVMIKDVVESLIQALLLQDHADKVSMSYRHVFRGMPLPFCGGDCGLGLVVEGACVRACVRTCVRVCE